MPSIAGVAIVLWLGDVADEKFQELLLLPPTSEINTPKLILLFLYGNLFCYVASYPILTFHATRVLDFKNPTWSHSHLWNGYIVTAVLSVVVLLISLCLPNGWRYWGAFLLAFAFSFYQVVRIFMSKTENDGSPFSLVQVVRIFLPESENDGSPAYNYAFAMAKRRSLIEEITSEVLTSDKRKNTKWREDLMETYRHMREHGNSGFIFLLELILAGLIYCILVKNAHSGFQQLSEVGILLVLWAFPAALVHMLAQHLERRFSHYDWGGEPADEAD